jgi:hypothetical protein
MRVLLFVCALGILVGLTVVVIAVLAQRGKGQNEHKNDQ